MKQKQYLSAGEVAKALGVSVKTIQRWDKAGLITVVRTAHNQRRIPVSELARIIRGAGQERCVIYARVWGARQEEAVLPHRKPGGGCGAHRVSRPVGALWLALSGPSVFLERSALGGPGST